MRLRPTRLALPAAATLALLVAAPPLAHAQSDADRATARALGGEGQTALDAKDYKTAEVRFRKADQLVHAPTLALGLARSLAGEAKYVEAQETYNRIVREGVFPGAPEAFVRAVEEAKKEVESVSGKVAGATITVQGPGGTEVANPRVTLDEVMVNAASLGVRRLVDPGSHVLKVAADGFKPAEVHFSVNEGGAVSQTVTLDKDPNATASTTGSTTGTQTTGTGTATTGATQPDHVLTPPAPASHASPIPAFVAFGIGGAGLVLGAITGGIALGDHSSLSSACTGGSCPSTKQSDLDSYHLMGALSTTGFIIAGVGAATGAVLLLTMPKESSTGSGFHVTPAIGLGSVGAVGTF
jgi:hypothetical protein